MKHLWGLLIGLLMLSACHEVKDCEEEIYLIPEGFRGKIFVFFDQADGQEIEYEDMARLYKIPSSGFIKSQFSKNGGCMGDGRIKFFYLDSLGIRQPIDYFLDLEKDSIPTDRDYVLFTFLSDKSLKPDFVIHCVGHVSEFNELTQSVINLDPKQILESI